jgi:hypothetical protein
MSRSAYIEARSCASGFIIGRYPILFGIAVTITLSVPPYCVWPRVGVDIKKAQTNMSPRIENKFFILYLLAIYFYINMSLSRELR